MTLRRGLLAGLIGGLALALTQALLRFAGVGLPSELGADLVLPNLPVGEFLQLLGLLGGSVTAKRQAFFGGFAGSVMAGIAMGFILTLLMRIPALRRHPHRTLLTALIVVWGATIIALAPVLTSNYRGVPVGLEAPATALGLLIQFAIYVGVVDLIAITRGAMPSEPEAGRRTLLLAMAGGVLALTTGGLVDMLWRASALEYDGQQYLGPVQPLTPVDDFYVVTKNLIDPAVFPAIWRLQLDGAVDNPRAFELAELMALPASVQETTLECISNGVGRGLISNASWKGIPLADLLSEAAPHQEAVAVAYHGADGYLNTTSLATARNRGGLVAWEMNGQRLPERHGYPLRLLIPSAYGEVSVKWLTRIEVLREEEKGYYARQGWEPNFVETSSRIDFPKPQLGLKVGRPVQVQGVAYAADRGIEAVELSPDGGTTWIPARISYGQPMTWSLWSLDWVPATAGTHVLTVRARDGHGIPQVETARGSAPAGATGLHMVTVKVVA
ncbi:MAG TPA: molybdopterin-dependent oxidoreductase [Candidatus Dormibacteraeota bacterium]|jgi:DMSO/TMAO reductase YedYZ molybdopterin-dependent catalytic subunit|nr:molybdopterin-dependent oxidoreductase [Candidatus Dormibacteraeota bacterium]